MSTVWPVRTAAGGQSVLKSSWLDSGSRAEPIALRAWAGLPAVGLPSVTAPHGVPPLEVEVQRIADSIAAHQVTHPGILPAALVDQALATLRELVERLGSRTHRELVHGDAHFLNGLHTLPVEAAGWVAIGPLASAGIREWDVTALLRNRWEDAVATGDTDAALRRRVDLVSEIAGMDQSQVRAIAQAVTVDNLLWLLPRDPRTCSYRSIES